MSGEEENDEQASKKGYSRQNYGRSSYSCHGDGRHYGFSLAAYRILLPYHEGMDGRNSSVGRFFVLS